IGGASRVAAYLFWLFAVQAWSFQAAGSRIALSIGLIGSLKSEPKERPVMAACRSRPNRALRQSGRNSAASRSGFAKYCRSASLSIARKRRGRPFKRRRILAVMLGDDQRLRNARNAIGKDGYQSRPGRKASHWE